MNNINRQKILRMCRCAMFTALTSVLAVISVPLPMTPVPISLATFAVTLTGAVLGPLDGVIAVFVYILLGAAGLPVFSMGQGGVGVIAGPTGGFVIGYLLMAFLTGLVPKLLSQKTLRFAPRMGVQLIAMLAGTAGLYLVGCLWYMFYANVSLAAALVACFVPFIPGDALKLALASAIAARFAGAVKSPARH